MHRNPQGPSETIGWDQGHKPHKEPQITEAKTMRAQAGPTSRHHTWVGLPVRSAKPGYGRYLKLPARP